MSDFIEDGYSETGFIAAVDGVHGALEFEFRPALFKLADRITGLIQGERADWQRFADEAAKALGQDPKLLQSWTLKDSKGNPVQITAANCLRVKNQLFHKLWLIVAGQLPSDPRDGTQKPTTPEADSKN